MKTLLFIIITFSVTPSYSQICSDFSGDWELTCTKSGPSTPPNKPKKWQLRQQGCEKLALGDEEFFNLNEISVDDGKDITGHETFPWRKVGSFFWDQQKKKLRVFSAEMKHIENDRQFSFGEITLEKEELKLKALEYKNSLKPIQVSCTGKRN